MGEIRKLAGNPGLPQTFGRFQASRSEMMAKGQAKSNKEARKPKKEKVKTIAANPSTKGGGGLSKG